MKKEDWTMLDFLTVSLQTIIMDIGATSFDDLMQGYSEKALRRELAEDWAIYCKQLGKPCDNKIISHSDIKKIKEKLVYQVDKEDFYDF